MKRAPVKESAAEDKSTKNNRVNFDPGNMMLLLYPVVILLIMLLGGLVRAAEPVVRESQPEGFDIGNVRSGELLLPDKGGNPVPAARLSQDVQIRITGIAARVTVVQEFRNQGEDWVSGVYVFPLPDEAAVDRLKMRIGEREITGVIKEKKEAEEIYKQAEREGRKASLLSQNRPNMFTTRVANIGPGEKIVITMEYQQVAMFADNVFSLRFPLAITPRYIPGKPLAAAEEVMRHEVAFDETGWARNTDLVPDANEITPPQVRAEESNQTPVTLSIDLVAGFPLARLESLYHMMSTENTDQDHYLLRATGGIVPDHDFVLEWVPENKAVTAALFHEEIGQDRFLLLMLLPPHNVSEQNLPREVVFVLDVSGSMAGPSIVQAKAALRKALDGLRTQDRFNIISFSSTARQLFDSSRMATLANLGEAREHLDALQADGGTEMAGALRLALDGEKNSSRIRQVVFLTDGAVGNEQGLMGLIAQRIGDSRLFTVGIGAAPNDYFMTRAAKMGRGSFTYVGDVGEVELKIGALLSKLQFPALTDIQVRMDGSADSHFGELYPNPVPDLYHGEPLILTLQATGEERSMVISARAGGQPVEYLVDTSTSGSRPGVAALWARKKIRNLMESLALGADRDVVREDVVKTALKHKLVSSYTSLVAVDKEPSRPLDRQPGTAVVPTPAPRGLQMEAVFGGGARTATPSTLLVVAGMILIISALLICSMRGRQWARLS